MNQIGMFFMASFLFVIPAQAQEEGEESLLTPDAQAGMDIFQGSQRLENGGPACITCHNVTNDDIIPGGLFAVDLTQVYSVNKDGGAGLGISLGGWIQGGGDNNPMQAAYGTHPIDSTEAAQLTAFFQYTDAVKDLQTVGGTKLWLGKGQWYMLIGGGIGVVVIYILVTIIWANRKKKMVKNDIFARQNKTWDAKF